MCSLFFEFLCFPDNIKMFIESYKIEKEKTRKQKLSELYEFFIHFVCCVYFNVIKTLVIQNDFDIL